MTDESTIVKSPEQQTVEAVIQKLIVAKRHETIYINELKSRDGFLEFSISFG